MRTLLTLLLISLISCEIAENFVETNFITLKEIVDKMKSLWYWEPFVDTVRKNGKSAGVGYCNRKRYLNHISNLCSFLADHIDYFN